MNKHVRILVLITFAAAMIFSSPLLFRHYLQEGIPYGEQTYRNLIIASSIPDNEEATPYHYTLAVFSQLAGSELAAKIMSLLFGIFSAVVFYLLLMKLDADKPIAKLSISLFLTLPASLYAFSSATPDTMALFLILLSVYLASISALFVRLLSVPVVLFLLLFGPAQFLFALLLILACLVRKRKLQLLFLGSLAISAFSAWVYGVLSPSITFDTFLSDAVSDFGGLAGFGIFHIILALIGFSVAWKKRFNIFPAYVSAVFIVGAAGIMGNEVLIYAIFTISFFSAVALNSILRFKWEANLIKNLTLLLIFFGILFSTASYINRIALMEPTPEIADSLSWLRTQPPGSVVSDPSTSYWIVYFSQKKAIAGPQYKKVNENVSLLFASRNLESAKHILSAYKVSYIWIDSSMKEGEVWSRNDEGLLFLLRNNETFKKLDQRFGTETWEYIGEENG